MIDAVVYFYYIGDRRHPSKLATKSANMIFFIQNVNTFI